MHTFFNHFLLNCASLIAVLNPFGNVPLFTSFTDTMKPETRNKLFRLIVLTGFGIISVFAIFGDLLMTYLFRIEMKEIRMAGGIVLIISAIKNLLFFPKKIKNSGEETPLSEDEEIKQKLVPLAFPMLVGPGTLTTVILIKKEYSILYTISCAFAVFIIIHFLFKYSNLIEKAMGKLVLYIFGRVMQIFIMAIGIRIFFAGLFEMLKR